MRSLLWGGLAAIVAAVLSVGAAPAPAAAADISGNKRTKAVITPGPNRFFGTLERKDDSDWYRVTLKAGRNYGFQVYGGYCTRMTLRDPAGRVLLTNVTSDEAGATGFEFRSAATRTYFVEYLDVSATSCAVLGLPDYPTGFSSIVAMEVRGDATTRATIAPGQTINGLMNFNTDKDYFRAALAAGRTYAVVVDRLAPNVTLTVVDPRGKVVAGPGYRHEPLPFRVPRTGTYYVVVAGNGDDAGPYKLSLSTP